MAIARRNIDQLYHHQINAIKVICTDQNVVLATPATSGKSLVYTISAFERAMMTRNSE
ncbi:hypothetical protein [Halococcus sediminicola]|uniref:hypothetical protein n=1 Tax=Halococcus sediminicola TaxID=1264579 RepID=UPI000ABE21F2|nr:hypothetical protein [Halococcus sediminicola]